MRFFIEENEKWNDKRFYRDLCNKPKNLISQPQQQMRQELPWLMNTQSSTKTILSFN